MTPTDNLLQQLARNTGTSGTLLDLLERCCAGSVLVDSECRIVRLSDSYRRLLGLPDDLTLQGQSIESLVPNSLMRQVVNSAQPHLLDLMRFQERWFVVTRLPLVSETGQVLGAFGMVFFDEAKQLAPLIAKFDRIHKAEPTVSSGEPRYSFADLIGDSLPMRSLRQLALGAATIDSTVLLLGETGTGKELLAQAIHNASPRAHAPFVGVNIAALPESLVEAELFGTAPGAFTGASRTARPGRFERADGGTLFLDEIGDISPAVQSKLLRVLEEREIEPLGANQPRPVDVRVIAATSRDLPSQVSKGLFRADLYYRLSVLPLVLPPLRERLEDIPALAADLAARIAQRLGGSALTIDKELIERLQAYSWPGNVRELHNVLERTLLFRELPSIREFKPGEHSAPPLAAANATPSTIRPLAEQIAETERRAIQEALAASDNNRQQAARRLGISRAAFYTKLNRHGLE